MQPWEKIQNEHIERSMDIRINDYYQQLFMWKTLYPEEAPQFIRNPREVYPLNTTK